MRGEKIFSSEPGDGAPLALPRVFALILGALDVASWICLVLYTLFTPASPATQALGIAFGWVITLLYAATGLPGLALASLDRAPRIALALALAFPVGFMLLYGALTIASGAFA